MNMAIYSTLLNTLRDALVSEIDDVSVEFYSHADSAGPVIDIHYHDVLDFALVMQIKKVIWDWGSANYQAFINEFYSDCAYPDYPLYIILRRVNNLAEMSINSVTLEDELLMESYTLS